MNALLWVLTTVFQVVFIAGGIVLGVVIVAFLTAAVLQALKAAGHWTRSLVGRTRGPIGEPRPSPVRSPPGH